ncbi:MAG: RloB family protein, partial [Candidatus Methanomethylophilaceae archaeon]
DFIAECKRLQNIEPMYVKHTWIVFDYDERPEFDTIIRKAKKEGLLTGWSNPCIEVWFSAYFGELYQDTSSKCCQNKFGDDFKKHTSCAYTKGNKKIYEHLSENGDEMKAIERAERKYHEHRSNGITSPSKMCPCTSLHLLIKEIRDMCPLSE